MSVKVAINGFGRIGRLGIPSDVWMLKAMK